jgi:hypothetical protein
LSACQNVGGRVERNDESPRRTLRRQDGEIRRKAHGDVRASSSGRHIAARRWGRSRDRGRNGHRILRRVPVDGRHLGPTQGIVFHDSVRRSVWRLLPLHLRCETAQKARRSGASAKAVVWWGERRRGDRGVRGSVGSGIVGRQRPRRWIRAVRQGSTLISCPVYPIRRSGPDVVKTSGPPTMSRGALISAGRPRGESRGSGSGARAVRVHVVSFGWQKSVGRIARLLHREVARPRGDHRGR